MNGISTDTNNPRRPKSPLVGILLGVAAICLIIWLVTMVRSDSGLINSNSPSQEQPKEIDFSVADLSGTTINLSSLRGKVVLANFWATWCSPCKEEMPLLQAYYDAHKDEGFILLGVNVSDDPEGAQAYITENGYTFPVWSDPPGNVLIDLNMNGLPASLLIDENGFLVKRWIGTLSQEELDDIISPLLPPQ